MSDQTLDASARTRPPGAWVTGMFLVLALGAVAYAVVALTQRHWADAGQAVCVGVIMLWGAAQWHWPQRRTPAWAPYVVLLAATVWIGLELGYLF